MAVISSNHRNREILQRLYQATTVIKAYYGGCIRQPP